MLVVAWLLFLGTCSRFTLLFLFNVLDAVMLTWLAVSDPKDVSVHCCNDNTKYRFSSQCQVSTMRVLTSWIGVTPADGT